MGGEGQGLSLQSLRCSPHFTAKAACLIMPAQWACHNQLHIMGSAFILNHIILLIENNE